MLLVPQQYELQWRLFLISEVELANVTALDIDDAR